MGTGGNRPRLVGGRLGRGMPWWLAAVATVALLLVAAKAHGRQIRLEREQQGYFRVDFGARNPAAVEAIWRADRRLFWPVFGVGALLATFWAVQALVPGDLAFAALLLAWAFVAAFVAAGLASWIRLARSGQGPLPWRKRAQSGSVGWWLAVAAAAALVALSLSV
jgi:hypothetical protein